MQLTEQQLQRFWTKVEKTPGCWLWKAYKNKKGYGMVSIKGVKMLAHRVSFAIANHRDPGECFVLHDCDNPACVRPDHLKEGTHLENMIDMRTRSRAGKKLTPERVIAIRRARGTHRAIAAREGVTHRTVGQIKRRETWAHIT